MLAEHYNSAYSVPRAEYERQVQREFPQIARTIVALGGHPGSLLEIGCSYGSMLRCFRDSGWKTAGIEWDARATQIARDARLSVYTGAVEDIAPTMKRTFDVVLGSHVIEHARDPRQLVSALATLTQPGSL
ncbi:MAG: class I SAM-dependent methyltransferase, partial [Gemmatimonadota bacterium]|nr:class I SAM-dependent methyltransferase [Gemmatimonadota bacterium]